jgi:hypothetical protein
MGTFDVYLTRAILIEFGWAVGTGELWLLGVEAKVPLQRRVRPSPYKTPTANVTHSDDHFVFPSSFPFSFWVGVELDVT